MTTVTTTEGPASLGPDREPPNWFDITVGLAGEMAHPTFSRGNLAELRRMRPDQPDVAVFWRLLGSHGLLDGREMGPELETRWGLILHGLALMTPTAGGAASPETFRPSAHDPATPVGLALFRGGDVSRTRAFYSESRFNRLLTARGSMLHTLLARTFRMLGANQPFNWRQMARLILHEGYNEDSAEGVRRQMARAYYQAERRSAQAAQPADE